jgi:sugar/nucleoside kinase (ribokinase family)
VPLTFISKVGKDDFGRYCLEELEAKKVKTSNIIRDSKLRTGITLSLNFRDDKAQVTFPGTIPHLYYKDISQKVFREHDHLHISSFFLQEGLVGSIPQLFQDAKQIGMTISLDPNSDNKNQWNSGIWKSMEFVDLLMLDEMEAINIAKAKSLNRALEVFAQKVPTVVIKLGSKGTLAKSRGQVVQLPAFKVKPIDLTGVGESFDAGLLFAQLNGYDLRKSLLIANAAGALSTQGLGGTTTQATFDEVQRFIRKHAQAI